MATKCQLLDETGVMLQEISAKDFDGLMGLWSVWKNNAFGHLDTIVTRKIKDTNVSIVKIRAQVTLV